MKEIKKNLLSDNIPSIKKDKEGKLRGGFTSVSCNPESSSDSLVNIVCNGCNINIPCSNKSCSTAPPATTVPPTKAPTDPPPTPESTGVLFGLNSSVLF